MPSSLLLIRFVCFALCISSLLCSILSSTYCSLIAFLALSCSCLSVSPTTHMPESWYGGKRTALPSRPRKSHEVEGSETRDCREQETRRLLPSFENEKTEKPKPCEVEALPESMWLPLDTIKSTQIEVSVEKGKYVNGCPFLMTLYTT